MADVGRGGLSDNETASPTVGMHTTGHAHRKDDATMPTAAHADDPTRVVMAGDWHGNLRWGLAVIDHAAHVGAQTILHLGDFGVWQGRPGREYLHHLDERLTQRGVTLAFVDGNHENHEMLAAYPRTSDGAATVTDTITYLPRGHRWVWHGQTWLALGGATSVDRQQRTPGWDWWASEEITAGQAHRVVAEGGPVEMMLCHDVPEGVPALERRIAPNPFGFPAAELRSAHQHRLLLRFVVDAVHPTQLWHGHYHWSYQDTLPLPDGHRVAVTGLDKDGTTLEENTAILDLDAAHSPRRFDMPL